MTFFVRMRVCIFLLLLLPASHLAAADSTPAKPAHPLSWDAMEKTIEAKPDEGAATFQFTVTNTSGQPVEIFSVQPSCGCTVAEMPSRPWIIAPGAQSSFKADVD